MNNVSLNINKLGFIGFGNMATAIFHGILSSKLLTLDQMIVSGRSADKFKLLSDKYGINTTIDNNSVVSSSEVIILAVKPQMFEDVLKPLKGMENKLLISILAGVKVESLKKYLPESTRVVRVMPNTPSLIRMGCTAICKDNISDRDLKITKQLFDSVGMTVNIEESMVDVVSAISGSGPAYFYLLIEALADAGVRLGLSKDLAIKLAASTAEGAARMIIDTGEHPSILKDRVTSPGGTTIEALKVMESYKVRAMMSEAVEAATEKSKLLAKYIKD